MAFPLIGIRVAASNSRIYVLQVIAWRHRIISISTLIHNAKRTVLLGREKGRKNFSGLEQLISELPQSKTYSTKDILKNSR